MTRAATLRLFLSVAALVFALSTVEAAESIYRDKNKYFEITPPDGWVKKEFNDPRSKVSFDVPAPIAGQNKAGLFFLSHPVSREIDLKAEAEDRVSQLKQMGSPDAKATTVDFAGVKAERVDGQMGRQNMLLRVFMFTKYGRSYTVQYSATKQDFDTYWRVAENALRTFKCIPPTAVERTSEADKAKIETEKIRVWISALKVPDAGTAAMNSLIAAGEPARPAVRDALAAATGLQRERLESILKRLARVAEPSRPEQPQAVEASGAVQSAKRSSLTTGAASGSTERPYELVYAGSAPVMALWNKDLVGMPLPQRVALPNVSILKRAAVDVPCTMFMYVDFADGNQLYRFSTEFDLGTHPADFTDPYFWVSPNSQGKTVALAGTGTVHMVLLAPDPLRPLSGLRMETVPVANPGPPDPARWRSNMIEIPVVFPPRD